MLVIATPLLLGVVITDLVWGLIPNEIVYSAAVLAVGVRTATERLRGLLSSLGGMFIAFVPGFVLFLAYAVGGGDVKLGAALGALLGVRIGGVMAFIVYTFALTLFLLVALFDLHLVVRFAPVYAVATIGLLALHRILFNRRNGRR